MLPYPQIDPVMAQLGPIKIYWYGFMYFVSFIVCWRLALSRCCRPDVGMTRFEVNKLIFYIVLGVIVGGAIGNLLFYHFMELVRAPWRFFSLLFKGRSFHGGLIGVLVGYWLFGRRYNKSFLQIADFLAPVFPIGLGLGRLGNFINGELWGRVTQVPWAMVFPRGGPYLRHPTQLYEFFFEGVVMFIVMWWYSSKPRPRGAVGALFIILYGLFRSFVEFFREPDVHLPPLFGWMTRGMQLCIPMILVGLVVMVWAYRSEQKRTC